jgi:hypothetical protein
VSPSAEHWRQETYKVYIFFTPLRILETGNGAKKRSRLSRLYFLELSLSLSYCLDGLTLYFPHTAPDFASCFSYSPLCFPFGLGHMIRLLAELTWVVERKIRTPRPAFRRAKEVTCDAKRTSIRFLHASTVTESPRFCAAPYSREVPAASCLHSDSARDQYRLVFRRYLFTTTTFF